MEIVQTKRTNFLLASFAMTSQIDQVLNEFCVHSPSCFLLDCSFISLSDSFPHYIQSKLRHYVVTYDENYIQVNVAHTERENLKDEDGNFNPTLFLQIISFTDQFDIVLFI